MLIKTPLGLYCSAGDFYIDPRRSVTHAVITHAHSDHAYKGSKKYYCVKSGVSLLKSRLGNSINVQNFSYGDKFYFNDVAVSFHPAGHILGSSQVRIEYGGEVWVVSGDYKRDHDPTCEPFEPVICDVFITEATFGTPAYRWKKAINFGDEINAWYENNNKMGYSSVVLAYSLGKTQRILGALLNRMNDDVICDVSAENLNQCYRAEGIHLASSISINKLNRNNITSNRLFVVPPSFLRSEKKELLGNRYKVAFASGWMANNHYQYYDKGFTMSDHADWDDLIRTIIESKAKQVFVQHRGAGALVKALRSLGISAHPDSTLTPKDPRQLLLF